MENYIYETHSIRDPLLPFIFHKRFDVSERDHFALNWHKNIELLYCIGGSGYVRCGLERTAFSQGDLFVVNADIPHDVGSDCLVSYRCLIVDDSFCEDNGIPIGRLRFRPLIRDEKMGRLFEAVTEAFDRRDSGRICAVADIRFAVLDLIRNLCAAYGASEYGSTQKVSIAHVKKALTYIRAHMAEPISLEAMAGFVGISKFHLSHIFKEFTGQRIIETVNLIRCAEARRLIEEGMGVSAAAAACGFENLSYFSRTFRRICGILPSACSKGRSTEKC